MNETIGTRLKQRRERQLLTQKELGERAGVPVVTISRIETGWRDFRPYPSTVRKLAAALDVDAQWLMFGEGDSDQVSGE